MSTQVDSLLFNTAKNGYEGAGATGYKDIKKVSKLPKFGQSGILYQVPKSGDPNNLYDEYVWTGIEFKLFMENVDGTATPGTAKPDENTTYTVKADPNDPATIILMGSDGSESSVKVVTPKTVDTNTTYVLSVADGKIILTSSDGAAQSFELPIQDVSGLATKAEVTAVEEKIPSVSKAGVSGSYNDLTDKPAIPAAYNDAEVREGLQKVQEDVSKIKDTNTTYTLEKDENDPNTAHLKGSDGSDQAVTFPDENTVYDDAEIRKEISDVKSSIPAAYDDTAIKKEISDVKKSIPVDTNTTYTISQDKDDPHKLIFTGSDGSKIELTTADTVYNDTDIRNKLGAKVNSASLSKVATTGSYNDLTDKPEITTEVAKETTTIVEDREKVQTLLPEFVSASAIPDDADHAKLYVIPNKDDPAKFDLFYWNFVSSKWSSCMTTKTDLSTVSRVEATLVFLLGSNYGDTYTSEV